MFKKMKSVSGLILAAGIASVTAAGAATPVMAAEDYSGKTVIIYSANLRGNVDYYARLATAKKDYEKKGAKVYLVDAGNYLQGSTYANSDRGLSIYNLMDAAGYDVAGMGTYDFVHADATVGMMWHNNIYKYYTQAELLNGAEELEYVTGGAGNKATRAAKDPVGFTVVVSNMTIKNPSYYSFATFYKGGETADELEVGFMAITDPSTPEMMQDNYMDGYTYNKKPAIPSGDVIVCLDSNTGAYENSDVDILIPAASDDSQTIGAYIIDNDTLEIKQADFNIDSYSEDAQVKSMVNNVKKNALPVVAKNDATLVGADRIGWTQETNLGDLTSDALVWYANNKMKDFKKDVPLVGIINGGNCDQYIYNGEITRTDLFRGLPFSPMGIGIVYLTGAQLMDVIESSQNMNSKNYEGRCPGFAQVSNMEYVINPDAEYDAGEEYGNFYRPASIQVTTIKSVNGEAFDPEGTYALVADNFIMNGGDTYAAVKEAIDAGATYINNGNGVLTRNIVEMYLKEKCGGVVPEEYNEPQGRIIVCSHEETTVVNKKDATTTEEGYTGDEVCNKCGLTVKEGEVIPKLDFKPGWNKTAAGWKYLDNNGVAYTGWKYMTAAEGEKTPHWSYFGNDGILRTGWQKMGTAANPDNGKKEHWSYFGPNGWLRLGWQQLGKGTSNPDGNAEKHWSYFGNDGWLTTGWKYLTAADGESTPHWSYFGGNGWLVTGWKYLTAADGETTPHWSYFGDNGWLRLGWQYLTSADGESTPHWSYFGNNGWLVTGWKYFTAADGEKTPHWSYFGPNGWLRLGWQQLGKGTANPDGNNKKHTSYFGDNGWMRTGKKIIGGKKYIFDNRGWLQ